MKEESDKLILMIIMKIQSRDKKNFWIQRNKCLS